MVPILPYFRVQEHHMFSTVLCGHVKFDRLKVFRK